MTKRTIFENLKKLQIIENKVYSLKYKLRFQSRMLQMTPRIYNGNIEELILELKNCDFARIHKEDAIEMIAYLQKAFNL